MGIIQFLKEGFYYHKAIVFKVVLGLATITIFLFTGAAYVSSQRLQNAQSQQYANLLFNHTQTLAEIKGAVDQLKASNAEDHTATIKYINCVLVGLTEAGVGNTPNTALSIYQTCLANSQIPPGAGL